MLCFVFKNKNKSHLHRVTINKYKQSLLSYLFKIIFMLILVLAYKLLSGTYLLSNKKVL